MSQLRSHLGRGSSGAEAALVNMIGALQREVDSLSSTVAALSLGLDPHRFTRFRSVTPIVLKTVGGPYQAVQLGENLEQASEEDVDFCISFVIETAVTLADLQI